MTLTLAIIFSALALALNPSIMTLGAGLLLTVLVAFGRRESVLVNPYFLFLSTPIALMLYASSVSPFFLPQLQPKAQLIILAGIYAYFLGLLCIKSGGVERSRVPPRRHSFRIVVALGLIPHVLGIANAGIPLFAADVDAAREAYLLPIVGQFTLFLSLSVLIAFRERSRKLVLLSVVLNLAFSIAMVSKFNMVLAAIFVFSGYVLYDGKSLFKLRPAYFILATAAITPVVFEFTTSVRSELAQTEYFWRSQILFANKSLNEYGDYVYLPYLYLTTPWSNLAYLTENPPLFSNGARTFYSLASIFQVEWMLNFEGKPFRSMPFNTHAFLADFYLDFGAFGAVLLAFLLGLFVKWSYVIALKRPNIFNQAIWICVGFASFLLFFSNHFTSLTYPLLAFVLFNAYRLISRSVVLKSQYSNRKPITPEGV